MNKDRIHIIKDTQTKNQGTYVLYWMQHSQRISYNHALLFAIEKANEKQIPLVVFFAVSNTFSNANQRHYTFMLEGIKEVKKDLIAMGANFVLNIGNPPDLVLQYLNEAETFVMDFGYLNIERKWRSEVINHIQNVDLNISAYMIESDLIVPIHAASLKVEYGAYTIRPKLNRLLPFYRDFIDLKTINHQVIIPLKSDHDLEDISNLISKLNINKSITISSVYKGGYRHAKNKLDQFIKHKINHYPNSNDPSKNLTSELSMYIHFGQISSLEIFETLFDLKNEGHILEEAFDAYVEQLFIRRELAYNFVYYQNHYDQFDFITESWAYQTMAQHSNDPREYIYTKTDYLNFQTHDPYFNAAMKQMVKTGYMHNYMRMYWGKKIIEWSPSHQIAFEIMLDLNNTYFIDGHNPNGYTGIAWCFGKHDRPWSERPIFGKLRYMNAEGLKRKFDIDAYASSMNHL
jgi:deoxyribodipyrimidine photo-lyase